MSENLSPHSYEAALAELKAMPEFQTCKPWIQEVVESAFRKGFEKGSDGPSWRYVNRNELPDGAPVEPGTTLYAFRDGDVFHWEYELPALPHATNRKTS